MKHIPPVITIDGPSGVGKGTIAKMLAKKLGWHYLDSGILYRVVAWAVQHYRIDISDDKALEAMIYRLQIKMEMAGTVDDDVSVHCNGYDITQAIRTQTCSEMASKISTIPIVRSALLQRQREMQQFPGLVTDGRDMGTVVFPNAIVKFYFVADIEERSKRRYNQLKEKGIDVSLPNICRQIQARDRRDEHRSIAPLRPAEDVMLIDTTNLSVKQVLDRVIETVNAVIELGALHRFSMEGKN